MTENKQTHLEEAHYENGQIKFRRHFKSGQLHRDDDLPAVEEYHENGQIKFREWFKDGKLHREGDFTCC